MNTLPETPAFVHFGVDVAKDELVLDCLGRIFRFPNDSKGVRDLLKKVTKSATTPWVVCEASGGYERLLSHTALELKIAISVVPPKRVRDFAKSRGQFAKSDPIDAAVITRFAAGNDKLKPLTAKDSIRNQLDALLRARAELLDLRQREKNRADHRVNLTLLTGMHKKLDAIFKAQIAALDKAIAALVASDEELAKADAMLREVKGVGPQTSRTLLAFMPELGRVNRRTIAALAGLAPFDNESGKKIGNRYIQGGRSRVRQVLHMAALVASRSNEVLKAAYQNLLDNGKKKFKVAIVAIARKLLVHLNSLMAKFLENPLPA